MQQPLVTISIPVFKCEDFLEKCLTSVLAQTYPNIKLMLHNDLKVKNAKVLVLGFTFKENCPDVRNTKVIDVVKQLKEFGTNVVVFDPWANPNEVQHEYNIITENTLPNEKFEAIVLAVSHREFQDINLDQLLVENGVIYDVKGILEKNNKIKGL